MPLTYVPHNEWPDPQFCIQDANAMVTMMNNQLTGTLNQIVVSSYTVGSRNVTAYTSSTDQLAVGDLVYFNAPADSALLHSAFRVTAVVPNTSFSFTIEYKDGVPTTSAGCLVNPMQRGSNSGQVGGQSGGLVTGNIKKYANGSSWPDVWISERAAHVGLLKGCRRVLVFRKVTAGDEYVYWEPRPERRATLAGTPRAVGAAVYVANGAGASARARIVDSAGQTFSSATATGATRTWLSAQKTAAVGTGAWQEGLVFSGPAGSTFVVGEFTSAGSPVEFPDGSFSTPRAQRIMALTSISPWVGANLTTPASGAAMYVDMKQASYGTINEGVTYLTGLLEGQSDTAQNILPSRANVGGHTLYNPVLHAPVGVSNTFAGGDAQNYAFASGNFMLDEKAGLEFYAPAKADRWGFLSWDIHGAMLYADA